MAHNGQLVNASSLRKQLHIEEISKEEKRSKFGDNCKLTTSDTILICEFLKQSADKEGASGVPDSSQMIRWISAFMNSCECAYSVAIMDQVCRCTCMY